MEVLRTDEVKPGSTASDAAIAAAHHLANTDSFVDTASLMDMAIDTSADHIVAEFVLESSMDEGIVIRVCLHVQFVTSYLLLLQHWAFQGS